jgi:hypothetical protein
VEVPVFLLTEGANVSREGKVNILGCFDILYVGGFPAGFLQFFIWARVETGVGEPGDNVAFTLGLADPDGRTIFELEEHLELAPGEPGYPRSVNLIVPVGGVVFDRPGDYVFYLRLEGESRRWRTPLRVVAAPSLSPGQSGPP